MSSQAQDVFGYPRSHLLAEDLPPVYTVKPAADPVNHPPHYTNGAARCECGKVIECVQVTRHMGFCLGNAVKYVWRAEHKGARLEDLKKARWYLDHEIQSLEAEATA